MPKRAILLAAGAATAPAGVLALVLLMAATDTPAAASAPGRGPYGSALRPGSVPARYVPMIERAAGACDQGLTSPRLAAQLHQESGFDPNAQSPAGAQGMAQFVPDTWHTWGRDAEGNGVTSPFDPADAIDAQGRMMCSLIRQARDSGIDADPWQLALAGYNAGWHAVEAAHGIPPYRETRQYVAAVVAAVPDFTAPLSAGPQGPADGALPPGWDVPAGTHPQAAAAIRWALAQRGGWYTFGGDCADPLGTAPSHRCDCSSLVQQAYAHAGIRLSRSTFTQVGEGQPVDPDSIRPGDLVFTTGTDGGGPGRPGHVALYIGDGLLLEAPRTGLQIRTGSYQAWRAAGSGPDQVVAVRRIVT
ncbi:NlpC/P60 family protein [Kitasatospora sp. NPDC001261]|uniref:C40 family peptidase n=1 Tax=Kitasatospora sp. NPDC001261 TaxID=3364012 RepID=UPI003675B8AD